MYLIELQRLNDLFAFETIATIGEFDFIADAATWVEDNVGLSDSGTHPMQVVAVAPGRHKVITLLESHPIHQVG